MTRYFLYIQCGLGIDAQTRFYKVKIGMSESECRVNAWLEAFAAEHGHLFVLWSTASIVFYEKCVESLMGLDYPLIYMSGSQLRQQLRTGIEDPACWQAVCHRNALLRKIDPRFYAADMIRYRVSMLSPCLAE